MPRVSRSTGPVFANAAPAYATDVSTLNANTPFASGACSDRRFGPRCSSHSFSAFCTQNPAEEIVNSLPAGRPLRWVMAKNGTPWKSTFPMPGFSRTPSRRRHARLRAPRALWRRRPEKMQSASLSSHSAAAVLVLRLCRNRAERLQVALDTRVRERHAEAYGRVGGRHSRCSAVSRVA